MTTDWSDAIAVKNLFHYSCYFCSYLTTSSRISFISHVYPIQTMISIHNMFGFIFCLVCWQMYENKYKYINLPNPNLLAHTNYLYWIHKFSLWKNDLPRSFPSQKMYHDQILLMKISPSLPTSLTIPSHENKLNFSCTFNCE